MGTFLATCLILTTADAPAGTMAQAVGLGYAAVTFFGGARATTLGRCRLFHARARRRGGEFGGVGGAVRGRGTRWRAQRFMPLSALGGGASALCLSAVSCLGTRMRLMLGQESACIRVRALKWMCGVPPSLRARHAAEVSEAHYNPAITLANAITASIHSSEAPYYILAQLAAAIAATALFAVTGGALPPAPSFDVPAAIGVLIGSTTLCLVHIHVIGNGTEHARLISNPALPCPPTARQVGLPSSAPPSARSNCPLMVV